MITDSNKELRQPSARELIKLKEIIEKDISINREIPMDIKILLKGLLEVDSGKRLHADEAVRLLDKKEILADSDFVSLTLKHDHLFKQKAKLEQQIVGLTETKDRIHRRKKIEDVINKINIELKLIQNKISRLN